MTGVLAVGVAERLCSALHNMHFDSPVTHVYNPLDYAWSSHEEYLKRYGAGTKQVIFLGMNPGPWGMAQTGVPFGEVAAVSSWLEIDTEGGRPANEHPKRRVDGFACSRSEVSGRRLWGWVRRRFDTPERFFARFFVANYCPLMFLEESGRNRTPDRLPAGERKPLLKACDQALRELVEVMKPQWVVGVGRFAEGRAREALGGIDVAVGRILHPSPASPAANRGWEERAEAELENLGISLR